MSATCRERWGDAGRAAAALRRGCRCGRSLPRRARAFGQLPELKALLLTLQARARGYSRLSGVAGWLSRTHYTGVAALTASTNSGSPIPSYAGLLDRSGPPRAEKHELLALERGTAGLPAADGLTNRPLIEEIAARATSTRSCRELQAAQERLQHSFHLAAGLPRKPSPSRPPSVSRSTGRAIARERPLRPAPERAAAEP